MRWKLPFDASSSRCRHGPLNVPDGQHQARRDGVLPDRGARLPSHHLPPVPLSGSALWSRRRSSCWGRSWAIESRCDARNRRYGSADGLVRVDALPRSSTHADLCFVVLYRFVINDTFRSSLCLIHPPHLIAIAAIYLAFSLHPPPLANITASSTNPSPAATAATGGPASRTRRQSVDTSASSPSTVAPLPPAPTSNPLHASLPARPSGLSSSTAPTAATSAAAAPPPRTGPIPPGGQTDPITFLSSLAIDHSLVLEIVQEVISLYELWNALESPSTATTTNKGRGGSANVPSGMGTGKTTTVGADERVVAILARMSVDRQKEIQREREQGKGTPSWKKG